MTATVQIHIHIKRMVAGYRVRKNLKIYLFIVGFFFRSHRMRTKRMEVFRRPINPLRTITRGDFGECVRACLCVCICLHALLMMLSTFSHAVFHMGFSALTYHLFTAPWHFRLTITRAENNVWMRKVMCLYVMCTGVRTTNSLRWWKAKALYSETAVWNNLASRTRNKRTNKRKKEE